MSLSKSKLLKITTHLFYLFLGFIFSVTLLISVVQYYSFNEGYYRKQFQKNNITSATGLKEEQLHQVIHQMTGYLSGRESSFNLSLKIDGEETLVFNPKELAHMLDVKVIYVLMSRLKLLFLVVLLGIFIPYSIFIWQQGRQHRNAKTVSRSRKYRIRFTKTLSLQALFTQLFAIALIFMIYTDFSKYFIRFHEIFFDNDLWLLDPATDRLIQMLPETFFYDISFQIAVSYYLISTVLGVVSFALYILWKREDETI